MHDFIVPGTLKTCPTGKPSACCVAGEVIIAWTKPTGYHGSRGHGGSLAFPCPGRARLLPSLRDAGFAAKRRLGGSLALLESLSKGTTHVQVSRSDVDLHDRQPTPRRRFDPLPWSSVFSCRRSPPRSRGRSSPAPWPGRRLMSFATTPRSKWPQAAKPAGPDVLETTLNLPQGFYEIEFPATQAAVRRRRLAGEPGGRIPSSPSTAASPGSCTTTAMREGLVRVAKRSGIGMIRERLTWGAVHPAGERGTGRGRRDSTRSAGRTPGRREGAGDGPRRPGLDGPRRRVSGRPPGHGRGVAAIAGRWQATWGAVEVWNEPDISFGGLLPADQYVPLAKTLAYVRAQVGLSPVAWPAGGRSVCHAATGATSMRPPPTACWSASKPSVSTPTTARRHGVAGDRLPRVARRPRSRGHAPVDHRVRPAVEAAAPIVRPWTRTPKARWTSP